MPRLTVNHINPAFIGDNGAEDEKNTTSETGRDGNEAASTEFCYEDAKAVDMQVDTLKNETFEADGKCGLSQLQRCANQPTFIIVYGLIGCLLSVISAYFNGTITTLEKRFHMSSRSIGIAQVGNDFTQVSTSLLFIYYAGKGHRPRYMALGVFTLVIYCLLTTLPHWLYGPGDESLKLTMEYGGSADENVTLTLKNEEKQKSLCDYNRTFDCDKTDDLAAARPVLILFLAHAISGIGNSLFYCLGYSYMDDNVEKSQTAAMYSVSHFLVMLGPSIGYTMAAFCLRQFIVPTLNPVIDNTDPRWIGAWWLGWLICGGILFVGGVILSLFPKKLPKFRYRSKTQDNSQNEKPKDVSSELKSSEAQTKPSFTDLLQTFKRIIKNKIYMVNNLSSVFYFFGYMPYWIFTPKYLEIQFRKSAAESNFYTGTVALVFTAIGVLVSGVVVSRKKPSARMMSGWNATVGFVTVLGILSYSLIGCSDHENGIFVEGIKNDLGKNLMCGNTCRCDYVSHAPVCGENNLTYISACHAGCKTQAETDNGQQIYDDCECVTIGSFQNATQEFAVPFKITFDFVEKSVLKPSTGGSAKFGACAVDCLQSFVLFLCVMCFLKFIGATTRANYFLIQVRSTSEEDKAVGLAVGMVMMSVLTFLPSPIFFGWLLDRMCLVWGKTCTEKGNCWLYDSHALRYTLNWTAASFICIGAFCDCTVCYLVKNLKVFDDEEKTDEGKIGSSKELAQLSTTM